MQNHRIESRTWGWLDVESYSVDGPFLTMVNAERNGKPFYPVCAIHVQDVKLIIPWNRKKIHDMEG